MKKMELSPAGKKRAAAGVAICFIATLVLTGAYTWRNYQNKIAEEERLMEEQMAKADEEAQAAKEASGTAKKWEEEVKNSVDEVTEQVQSTYTVVQEKKTATPNFTENSRLLWPVNGNVLMSYSMDKSVYFSTLDQYKYNPALVISGTLNDNVIAAAPGVVKSIDTMRETGTTVTVDMGNGYECLYGQLQDVQVKTGDYVNAKDVIGYVAEPTKYYSVEGCNLYFEMRKDGQPVNPMDYMSEDE